MRNFVLFGTVPWKNIGPRFDQFIDLAALYMNCKDLVG